MIENVDIVVGLAWGDEGKGKVTSSLIKDNNYSFVCRWAGGSNAGHTVYIDNIKYKTHIIPSGIFGGIPSIIGPGCVVNKTKLYKELEYLNNNNFHIDLVKVSPRAHIVSEKHIDLDKLTYAKQLGTTSNGIAPCYADKAARTGIRAMDVLPKKLLWDEELSGNILCEGAQGVWLDLDWGNYPYVTSSTTLPHGACSLGFPVQNIKTIYGVAKIYDTRSGIDPLFPEVLLKDPHLATLAHLGEEIGVTTGRRRKVQWLNLDMLINSINLTGTTDLIINKCDVIEKLNVYKLIYSSHIAQFDSMSSMTSFLEARITENCSLLNTIIYSRSPLDI